VGSAVEERRVRGEGRGGERGGGGAGGLPALPDVAPLPFTAFGPLASPLPLKPEALSLELPPPYPGLAQEPETSACPPRRGQTGSLQWAAATSQLPGPGPPRAAGRRTRWAATGRDDSRSHLASSFPFLLSSWPSFRTPFATPSPSLIVHSTLLLLHSHHCRTLITPLPRSLEARARWSPATLPCRSLRLRLPLGDPQDTTLPLLRWRGHTKVGGRKGWDEEVKHAKQLRHSRPHARSGSACACCLHAGLSAGGQDRAQALRSYCQSALGPPLFDLIYSALRKRVGGVVGGDEQVFRQELQARLGASRMQYVYLIDQLIYLESIP
jgi:hypothetical protein